MQLRENGWRWECIDWGKVGWDVLEGLILGAVGGQLFKWAGKGLRRLMKFLFKSKGGCFVGGTLVATALGTVPIDELQVGDRVRTSYDTSTQVDSSTWWVAQIELDPEIAGGRPMLVTLLRPADWYEFNAVGDVGDQLYLDMPELGVEGWGTISRFEPLGETDSAPGRMVVTTIERDSDDVYELSFVEGANSLRGTGVHPLYSLDRGDWVHLQDLQAGERLQTKEGTVTVEGLQKVPGIHTVYNVEVEGDHEYLIGDAGIRAHNTCWLAKAVAKYGDVPPWMKDLNPHGHHIIPQKGGGYWGDKLRALGKRNGIKNHIDDLDNLTIAPNGSGTHKYDTWEAVYKELAKVDGMGEQAFRRVLRRLGKQMRTGTWYKKLGLIE